MVMDHTGRLRWPLGDGPSDTGPVPSGTVVGRARVSYSAFMHRHRFPVKLLGALLALYQVAAPGYASIVDARPEARAASAIVAPHVESTGRQHAGSSHDERCVLWQFSRMTGERAPAPFVLDALGEKGSIPAEPGACIGADHAAARQARAPPVA